jgi:hypothetical protein
LQWLIFRHHYILGQKAGEVQRLTGLSRNTGYYHEIERIEQTCGKAFASTRPYSVWPIREYFQGTDEARDLRPFEVSEPHKNGIPLRAPLLPKPVPAAVEMPNVRHTGLLRPGHKKAA